MRRPIAKKYREGKLKIIVQDEIQKVDEFKPILQDPYRNTDQGDFHYSEEKTNKSFNRKKLNSYNGKTRKIVNYICWY